MLVICALALVVAAAVFLVIGLAGGDVGDLYLSMVLCVASLVVVAVSARLSRVRPAKVGSEPPEAVDPIGAEEAEGTDREEAPVASVPAPAVVSDPTEGLGDRLAKIPAGVAAAGADQDAIWGPAVASPSGARPAPEVDAAPQPEVEPARVEPQPEPEVVAAAAPADDATPFPIADYDDLAAEQILPLVPRLWPEEAPQVAARERATKARPAVLDALAQAAGDPSLAFPIAEYETLDTEQITRLLERLDKADLATVQVAERSGPARVGVLVAVANQLAART